MVSIKLIGAGAEGQEDEASQLYGIPALALSFRFKSHKYVYISVRVQAF